MAVYLILDIEVTDADTYGDYVKQAPATVAPYGGEPIAEDDDLFGTTSRPPATPLAANVLHPAAAAAQRYAAQPTALGTVPQGRRSPALRPQRLLSF